MNSETRSPNVMNVPGFTLESIAAVEEMLYGEPDWNKQFLTGKSTYRLPRENKTTIAPSLQTLDIDNTPGKQKGDQGKQKQVDSRAIFPVALPQGNPQPGPRSRSDLKGFAMFEEAECPKPKNRATAPQKPVSEQPQNKPTGVTPDKPPAPPKPKNPAQEAERKRKRETCSQRQGAGAGVTFEEACKPRPKPRSPEQQRATRQATSAAQQQGQTFDSMPRPQVQELGRQGGEAKRAPQKPPCPS